jgi:hypothetical protein
MVKTALKGNRFEDRENIKINVTAELNAFGGLRCLFSNNS